MTRKAPYDTSKFWAGLQVHKRNRHSTFARYILGRLRWCETT